MSAQTQTSVRRTLAALLVVAAVIATLATPTSGQDLPARVSGLVTDDADAPIEGARVQLLDEELWTTTGATTNAEGHFDVSVPAGHYHFHLSYEQIDVDSAEAVELAGGASIRLDLALPVRR